VTVTAFEAFPLPNIVALIEQAGRPILFEKLDPSAGAGIIDPQMKCVWTMSGKRVTITSGEGALIISISREVDPVYEAAKKAALA